jgi:hypothetical protein
MGRRKKLLSLLATVSMLAAGGVLVLRAAQPATTAVHWT